MSPRRHQWACLCKGDWQSDWQMAGYLHEMSLAGRVAESALGPPASASALRAPPPNLVHRGVSEASAPPGANHSVPAPEGRRPASIPGGGVKVHVNSLQIAPRQSPRRLGKVQSHRPLSAEDCAHEPHHDFSLRRITRHPAFNHFDPQVARIQEVPVGVHRHYPLDGRPRIIPRSRGEATKSGHGPTAGRLLETLAVSRLYLEQHRSTFIHWLHPRKSTVLPGADCSSRR